MTRDVRLRELLVGVEGLALLRHLYDTTSTDAIERLEEVAWILENPALDEAEAIAEAGVRAGYAAWSQTYDRPGNPIVAIEQPVVWGIVDSMAPGRALDAACGTGRHAAHLAQAGHEVIGVDLTFEMLSNVQRAAEADLRALPSRSDIFDLVVCGLAIAHVADLSSAIAELARVLVPGGRLVISALHPFQALLGWHAPFEDAAGRRGFVREHSHGHADYLVAFRRSALVVHDCHEPPLTTAHIRAKRRAFRHIPDAVLAAYDGLPPVLVWVVQKAHGEDR